MNIKKTKRQQEKTDDLDKTSDKIQNVEATTASNSSYPHLSTNERQLMLRQYGEMIEDNKYN